MAWREANPYQEEEMMRVEGERVLITPKMTLLTGPGKRWPRKMTSGSRLEAARSGTGSLRVLLAEMFS